MHITLTSRILSRGITTTATLGVAIGLIASSVAAHAAPPSFETGAATCQYTGEIYSEGTRLTQSDGIDYICAADGSWNPANDAPVARKKEPRLIHGVVSLPK